MECYDKIWLASIKSKRTFAHIYVYSHILKCPRREMHLRPSFPPFSPSDLEMPIQILWVIFVAIKCYVFGLMVQKYSILHTGRASSSWYKDKFGSLREGKARVTRIRQREEKSEWVYGTCRSIADTFTIRLTHVEERFVRREGRMREMELTFTRFSRRESEPWIRFANRKRPLHYLPLPRCRSLRRCSSSS